MKTNSLRIIKEKVNFGTLGLKKNKSANLVKKYPGTINVTIACDGDIRNADKAAFIDIKRGMYIK